MTTIKKTYDAPLTQILGSSVPSPLLAGTIKVVLDHDYRCNPKENSCDNDVPGFCNTDDCDEDMDAKRWHNWKSAWSVWEDEEE